MIDKDKIFERELVGLSLSSLGVFIFLSTSIYLVQLYFFQPIYYKLFDNDVITVADYSVEIPLSQNQIDHFEKNDLQQNGVTFI